MCARANVYHCPPCLTHTYYCVCFAQQLLGATTQTQIEADACYPLNKLGNITLNPCGLIANTLFNDVFTLTSGSSGGAPLVMVETGIAWESDLKFMFAQPDGFYFGDCPGACDETCCEGEEWSCKLPYQDPVNETKCYRYFYPNDNTTQYLYEVSMRYFH